MAVNRTKSSVFVLPMILGIPYKYFKGFVNCYIGCNYEDEDDYRIYVVFNTDDILKEEESIEGRVEILESCDQYIKSIVIDDYTLLVFRVDEGFKHDFNCFKEGRYRQFSDKYKKMLKRLYANTEWIHKTIDPGEVDIRLLSKELGEKLPDNVEIFDSPYESEEVFSLSHFIEVDL